MRRRVASAEMVRWPVEADTTISAKRTHTDLHSQLPPPRPADSLDARGAGGAGGRGGARLP
eukprot:312400-Rhodomonas_salina.1